MRKKITCIFAAVLCSLLPLAQTIPATAAETAASEQTASEAGSPVSADPYAVLKESVSYAIVPVNAGSSALDRESGKLTLNKANRAGNQRWQVKRVGSDYRIQTDDGKTALEVDGGKAESGKAVIPANTDSSNPAKQLWNLEDAGDGTFFIRSKLNNSYAMDVYGDRWDNGTEIKICGFHGKRNQRFRFVNLSETVPMEEWGAERTDCLGSDWDYWDGGTDQTWYYADTDAKTYQISTAAQLAGAAKLVKDSVCSFEGKTLQLTRDLDLCGAEWQPIGTSDKPFRGSFNGNNYAIVGLSITGKDDEVGFFGHVDGGSVCNFAIRGRVSGDWNTAGVCGKLEKGHLVNVYSEVTITRATDDNCGGICGRVSYGAYVEHCTQNARITSTSSEPDRGGIGGYCCGVIRWCVNMQTVDSRWDYVGGIAGHVVGGKIEYCANYGQVCGGSDTESAGGIFGKGEKDAYVCGCYNSGKVWSTGDDYIGGIGGRIVGDTPKVFRCVNIGDVSGKNYVGGVLGEGNCTACLNTGYVTGSSKVGAVTGNTKYRLDACIALSYTAATINGKGGSNDNGAEWLSASDIRDGKACALLNSSSAISGYGDKPHFCQNLGSDPVPMLSGAEVETTGEICRNTTNTPTLICDKNAGQITAQTADSSIVLKAETNFGYLFDHFEISSVNITKRTMYNGEQESLEIQTETVSTPEYVLTLDPDKAAAVKAVFREDDGTPDDLRQVVEVELKTVKGCGKWKNETVPVYLTDTAGISHLWEVERTEIDGDGETVRHSYDLGTASPVSVCLYPNTSESSLTVQAKLRFNGAADAVESAEVKINSGWSEDSMSGSKYIYIPFLDFGKSTVGKQNEAGEITGQKDYTKCSEAWAAAVTLGNDAVITLEGPWLINEQFSLSSGKLSIDLNGYPIIRCLRQTVDSGSVFRIGKGAELCITDSDPTRKSGSVFTGGSIQGGRSKDSAGLIHVSEGGKLTMNGGTLYNGGTSDTGGGAIQNEKGTVALDGVLISGCRTYDNSGSKGLWRKIFGGGHYDTFGGGIYNNSGTLTVKNSTIQNCRGYDHAGALMIKGGNVTLENVDIIGCKSDDDEGGAIYIDEGALEYIGGFVRNCSAPDNGGGIYQEDGTVLCSNVSFDGNYSSESGGAAYINTDDSTWFVGCSFRQNTSDEHGGAIWLDENNLYLEDCTVTNNASKGKAGGIYLTDNGSIDLCGGIVIKDNDGSGTKDNLVVEQGAWIYDQGLNGGSEIWVCLNSGTGSLTHKDYPISRYNMQYFKSDSGTLYAETKKQVSTRLQASVFTEGSFARYAGAAVIAAIGVFTLIYYRKKRKGEEQ